jgi:hypothetical protein
MNSMHGSNGATVSPLRSDQSRRQRLIRVVEALRSLEAKGGGAGGAWINGREVGVPAALRPAGGVTRLSPRRPRPGDSAALRIAGASACHHCGQTVRGLRTAKHAPDRSRARSAVGS